MLAAKFGNVRSQSLGDRLSFSELIDAIKKVYPWPVGE